MDKTLQGTTTLDQSTTKNNGYEEVLHISQTPKPEPDHLMQFNIIPKTLNSFKYCDIILIIQYRLNHLFAQS